MRRGPLRPSPGRIGTAKEALAGAFLSRQGLEPITRNYRCRFGELDLVMRDGGTLVFVEVRYRRSSGFGTPAESVDGPKRRRLIAAAQHYLAAKDSTSPCRFDVVALSGDDRMEWIKNAFSAGD